MPFTIFPDYYSLAGYGFVSCCEFSVATDFAPVNIFSSIANFLEFSDYYGLSVPSFRLMRVLRSLTILSLVTDYLPVNAFFLSFSNSSVTDFLLVSAEHFCGARKFIKNLNRNY